MDWVADSCFADSAAVKQEFSNYWNPNPETQKLFDEFSENTITNFYMPFGVMPNVLLNDRIYTVPMVIEESSVVAAASNSAKFWRSRGGFHARVLAMEKVGQVHFIWRGEKRRLLEFFKHLKPILKQDAAHLTARMEERGGGILDIQLVDMTAYESNYFQLKGLFDTCDSMGANFINSVLESFAATLRREASVYEGFIGSEKDIEVIMSILSNYTPNCIVRAWVECPVEQLGTFDNGTMDANTFAWRFARGVRVAQVDTYRATTHNKGIFNGIDSVILATGNDFRAIEACGHTYASRNGRYGSLTDISLEDLEKGYFKYTLEIPLALGTVGGLTSLHPLVKRGLEMLGNPNANELMQIAATVGLANNFSAIRSLVTVGIQKGHMKMHLLNILKTMGASEQEVEKAKVYFIKNVVSYSSVREFLELAREGKV